MAVVGGDTLLAREIRSVLEKEQPAARLQLISSNVDDAQVLSLVGKEVEEEAVVMAPLSPRRWKVRRWLF